MCHHASLLIQKIFLYNESKNVIGVQQVVIILQGQGEVTFPGSQSDTVCPLCGQNFLGNNRKNNLKQHLAIHSGLRPFQCYLCPQTFVRKSHLKRHLGTLHKEKLAQQLLARGCGAVRQVKICLLTTHLIFPLLIK